MKNRTVTCITIIIVLFSVVLFFTSCPSTDEKTEEPTPSPTPEGATPDPAEPTPEPTPEETPGPTGPFQCEIQFINNHTLLQYSLFLGINDDFFDIENVGGTDIINGEKVIDDIDPNGGTGSYTLELGMDAQIQKDWIVGTFTEFDVWSFLSPFPLVDGDGFTFVGGTNYTIEIHIDNSTVTISQQ